MSQLEFTCRHRLGAGFELNLSFTTDHLVTCLFGPSGSGKTSTLSILAGLLRPDHGRIRCYDDLLLDTEHSIGVPPEHRGFGYVFQDHLLFPHLTVEKNLRFGSIRRAPAAARQPAINFARVVQVLELEELLRRHPRHLSGGQRQRVALGRALLSRPRMLLMDEPLAALDDQLKGRILEYLERVIHEWSLPVLFVSHSQAEVRRLQGVVVIEQGRVIAVDTPDRALGTPQTLGWHNDLGPTNLLRIDRIERQGDRWFGWIGPQRLSLPCLLDSAGSSTRSASQPQYVQCAPGEVLLSRSEVAGLSARNQLRGTIREIVELPEGVFVAVDLGQILWSEVTPEAVRELQLQAGVEVICVVKTHSLRLV